MLKIPSDVQRRFESFFAADRDSKAVAQVLFQMASVLSRFLSQAIHAYSEGGAATQGNNNRYSESPTNTFAPVHTAESLSGKKLPVTGAFLGGLNILNWLMKLRLGTIPLRL